MTLPCIFVTKYFTQEWSRVVSETDRMRSNRTSTLETFPGEDPLIMKWNDPLILTYHNFPSSSSSYHSFHNKFTYHIHITILHSFLASTFLPLSLLPDFFHEQKTIKWQWLPVTIFEMFNDEQYLFEGKQLHFHNCSFGTSLITDYKCIFQ